MKVSTLSDSVNVGRFDDADEGLVQSLSAAGTDPASITQVINGHKRSEVAKAVGVLLYRDGRVSQAVRIATEVDFPGVRQLVSQFLCNRQERYSDLLPWVKLIQAGRHKDVIDFLERNHC